LVQKREWGRNGKTRILSWHGFNDSLPMKPFVQLQLIALLSGLLFLLSGCELIGDIFKAGVWVGVLGVVALIALIAFLMKRK